MTTNPKIKTDVQQEAILLIGEGLEKKDRLTFENWGFRNSPIGAPPGRSDDETGRWVTLFNWPWIYENYTPFLGRSIGFLSAEMDCLQEDVGNDYLLISGYVGENGFEGLQEELIDITHKIPPCLRILTSTYKSTKRIAPKINDYRWNCAKKGGLLQP